MGQLQLQTQTLRLSCFSVISVWLDWLLGSAGRVSYCKILT